MEGRRQGVKEAGSIGSRRNGDWKERRQEGIEEGRGQGGMEAWRKGDRQATERQAGNVLKSSGPPLFFLKTPGNAPLLTET